MDILISKYLRSHNLIEKKQLCNERFVLDIPEDSFEDHEQNMKLLKEYFLKNNPIYISKHPRFSDYPQHSHEFLELNYIYSGTSKQFVNGERVVLNEGEILLLGKGTVHSLEKHNEGDILINLIFSNDNIDIGWISSINTENNILFDFLFNNKKTFSNKGYVIFYCSDNNHIQTMLEQIVKKYFTDMFYANEIISLYIPILFAELIGNCNYNLFQENILSENNRVIIDILKLIKSDFNTITLHSIAKDVGYNSSYLSSLIKDKTGYTFSELVTNERIKQAKLLIERTDFSIEEIMGAVGIKNRNFFYKQFKKRYNQLPSSFRK